MMKKAKKFELALHAGVAGSFEQGNRMTHLANTLLYVTTINQYGGSISYTFEGFESILK